MKLNEVAVQIFLVYFVDLLQLLLIPSWMPIPCKLTPLVACVFITVQMKSVILITTGCLSFMCCLHCFCLLLLNVRMCHCLCVCICVAHTAFSVSSSCLCSTTCLVYLLTNYTRVSLKGNGVKLPLQQQGLAFSLNRRFVKFISIQIWIQTLA